MTKDGSPIPGRPGMPHPAEDPSGQAATDPPPLSVHRVAEDFDDDGCLVRRRFYTAGGTEVDADGEPIPPRPANVPEDARHTARHGHWFLGRTEAGGMERRIGLHCFWETDGTLKDVEYHTLDGGLLARFGTGSPLVEADRAGDAAAVELCFDLGLGNNTLVAALAAREGRTALALRILAGDGDTPAHPPESAEPVRWGEVPEEAVWVADLSAWAVGDVDPATGSARGTWRLWWGIPRPEEGPRTVVDFFAYRPSLVRAPRRWRFDGPDEERTYDGAGELLLRRTYRRGRPDAETEYLPDGTVAHRRFPGNAHGDRVDPGERIEHGERVVRVERDGALVSEEWFAGDGEGARVAEVLPCGIRVAGEPVEWWRALDPAGGLIAEGPVRPGPEGGPVGEWTLHGEEYGSGSATVGFDFDSGEPAVRRGAGLGRFAHALHMWRTMPLPEALTGVADVEWAGYQPFFGNAEDFPFLLKGLAVPDERAADYARNRLREAMLHRQTPSGIAAPAMRYVIALAESRPDDEALLRLVRRIVTRDGVAHAALELKILHQDAATQDDGAAHYAWRGREPAYFDIYTSLATAVPTWARLAREAPGPIREIARHLLAAAPGEQAAAALRDCMTAEPARPGDRDRAALGDLLLCVSSNRGAPNSALVEPFLDDGDPLLAFCAARAWRGTTWAPQPRGYPVLRGLSGPDAPGAHRTAGSDASIAEQVAITGLPPEQFRRFLDHLLTGLGTVGPFLAADLARALGGILFPEVAYNENDRLTPEQRRFVEAVIGALESRTFTDVDMIEVLRCNGLPTTADTLRGLCRREDRRNRDGRG
ncbi:hypothetical protein ACWDR0_06855 [Streptomyces sp. NPDC003691]